MYISYVERPRYNVQLPLDLRFLEENALEFCRDQCGRFLLSINAFIFAPRSCNISSPARLLIVHYTDSCRNERVWMLPGYRTDDLDHTYPIRILRRGVRESTGLHMNKVVRQVGDLESNKLDKHFTRFVLHFQVEVTEFDDWSQGRASQQTRLGEEPVNPNSEDNIPMTFYIPSDDDNTGKGDFDQYAWVTEEQLKNPSETFITTIPVSTRQTWLKAFDLHNSDQSRR